MNISIFQYIIAKFLQKSCGASRKFHFPEFLIRKLDHLHFLYVNKLLNPYFNFVMKKMSKNLDHKGQYNSKIIWVFWWQGYDAMPLIVKKCYQSIVDHANGYSVILVTKRNVTKYAKLPKILYNKVNNGKLDLTHFSDILRFNLLDNHGGLWVDSTIYCVSNITNDYFNYIYTTGGYHNTPPRFVKGRWAEFLIGSNKYNDAIRFEDYYLQLYYTNNNMVIDYFLADYGLNYSYNHNLGNYKNYVDYKAEGNNPKLFKLIELLNKPYNKNIINTLISNTKMFKLTYKMKFNDHNTYYDHLVHNNLYKK